MGVLYYTKYKSNSDYKDVYNYAILYFIVLIIIGLLQKNKIRLRLTNMVTFV